MAHRGTRTQLQLVYDQDAFETQARQLQRTHPLAKFPTITIIENQQTLHLAETSAISEWQSHHSQRLATMGLDSTALADNYYIGKTLQ